ncbi:hypothetical protein Sjap_010512 [Stephania japonica]|uniref:Fibronectin type-III domain-containing protein n=1 Tax=Stephania japonica TaxID=461633 RepID=A0AAP0JAL1_9MAGN
MRLDVPKASEVESLTYGKVSSKDLLWLGVFEVVDFKRRMSDPGRRKEYVSNMGFAYVLYPAKCSQLSLDKKRELLRRIATGEEDAPKILSCWNRRDLIEVLCAEMGKENKYTGLSKHNMVDILIKFSEKYKEGGADNELAASSSSSKRQKNQNQQLQLACHPDHAQPVIIHEEQQIIRQCQNAACRNTLSSQDQFCRRCACSICHCSDINYKDPSLWLTCGSFAPFEVGACGASCHLVCAFKDERVGIMNSSNCVKLDGCFRCLVCGKTTSIMAKAQLVYFRSWRRHLYVAMKARELHVLCCRLSICHAILKGSETYKEQRAIIELAVNKLQSEVGPINQVPINRERLIDRLPCRAVIQKLFGAAMESLDYKLSLRPLGCCIQFVEPTPVSVVVQLAYNDNLLQCFFCCKLWHRKAAAPDYSERASYIAMRPVRLINILNLDPCTKYLFKVAMYSSTRVLGVWEATFATSAPLLSLQANSPRDPANTKHQNILPGDVNHSRHQSLDSTSRSKGNPSPRMLDIIPNAESLPHNLSKKHKCYRDLRIRSGNQKISMSTACAWSSTIERRAVSTLVDILIDDPPSLAAQLVDAFKDLIYNEAKERGEGSSTAIIMSSRKGKEKAS